MKITNIKELKSLFQGHFEKYIESVNRARRGEETNGEYWDEYEGPGTAYESTVNESVDSVHNRSKERKGDYEDEYEGPDVSYESFVKEVEESNLYHDSDRRSVKEENDEGEDDGEPKSHAAPEDSDDDFPGPPMASEGRAPTLVQLHKEGYIKLDEVSPPGWEKTVEKMKGEKDIDNPFALAWSMHKKGAKPGEKKDDEE